MKKLLVFLLLIMPMQAFAARGCCSSHGGVCGCNKSGVQVCCDGSLSPTCRCEPPKVYGCTDYKANNYNMNANVDDGSCTYTVLGCTDPNANNYNPSANQDDQSCKYDIPGCMDSKAENYNANATLDDGTCQYPVQTNNENTSSNRTEDTSEEDELDPLSLLIGSAVTVGGLAAYGISKKS